MAPTVPSSYYLPALPSYPRDGHGDKYILFFITGNPGLIAYYDTFLSHLHALLATSPVAKSKNAIFDVCGRSLRGFEAGGEKHHGEHEWAAANGTREETSPPFGLQAQIEAVEASVKALVKREIAEGGKAPKVVLMGHSVGSYILLEVLRRHRARLAKGTSHGDEGLGIVGGICLFPTVTHIAKSQSGRRLTWLFNLPHSALIGSLLVKLLFLMVPLAMLYRLVALITRFPSSASSVTAAFLKSPQGVRESLHMAKQEMATITADTWDAEIWGAAHSSTSLIPRPRLFFLFGKEDHWVANETRDELIRMRAGEEGWRPKMEIDTVEGWPHGFSIKHSVPVAEKVKGYVEAIIEAGSDF